MSVLYFEYLFSGPKKGDRNMEGVITSCSGSHHMSYNITKHTTSFTTSLQTETYYEQSRFQEVLKVTNPAENENPALCQRNERKQSSPSPFANYHQAQNCEPETRGIL
ncbi:hypothetical protein CEXT_308591 [Caerostris extrusa]|uniref:Uncharacterized protein n=1 Tax=Caerostris extrusa TaxID=172846 RepID=A0AAV4XMB2_CAEEX|nr:hypothetical protein CEXT_308591 [Caerostris extrusa]